MTGTIMNRIVLAMATSGLLIIAGCGNEAGGSLPEVTEVRSLSKHYLLVSFAEPAGAMADQPASYVIRGPSGQPLEIYDVDLNEARTQAMLSTSSQDPVNYNLESVLAGQLPIGALGFLGSSTREPHLESAISLNNTEVLLTFSTEMDRATAENAAFYEIADPDGNTDIDIRITGATLGADFRTVVLGTSPQENLEYRVRVTNVERRFSCSNGGRIFLDDAAQGDICGGNYRPTTPQGNLVEFELTARTAIATNAPLRSDAEGSGGSVSFNANGAGVNGAECNGTTKGISGGNGSDPDEELIFTPDRAELADNIVVGMRDLDFDDDAPVLFVSSAATAGFDIVIEASEIRAALSTGIDAADIAFANLASIPAGLMVDGIKLRETNGDIWVNSICGLSTGGRLIDPTRNTAVFFGIPPIDTAGPQLVSAVSTSDTTVLLSFSEPLDSEAANPQHFSIAPDLTVISAELTQYDTQVILTTSAQRVDTLYTVTAMDVRDKAGNVIDPAADTATFSFAGGPAGLGAGTLPRVVGATSTGNTTVLVTFTKPMGASATVASNYIIVQENVNPEVGALSVLSAAFLTPQQDAVELTTLPQNEITYFLQANNVLDLSGNQLAPPELLVDPSTAIFWGTPFGCPPATCTNGHPGLDGNGLCLRDNDCTDTPPCLAGETCAEACAVVCTIQDSDGDGLADSSEQRGYVVFVKLGNGEMTATEVTSDPFSPDTDGDGLGDAVEKRIGSNPRSGDTDSDQLSDNIEFNRIYSSVNNQDSDEDGIGDFGEVMFYKTNANLDDSDGDGFSDGEELFELNRDPRVSDLPQPDISIGSVDLHIEELFTYSDEQGVTQTTESSTQTSLSMSASRSSSTSEAISGGFTVGVGAEFGISDGKFGWKVAPSFFGNFARVVQTNTESSTSAMSAFEQSLNKGLALTGSQSVTRDVAGARVDALVSLGNLSDVAFSLSNLEITVSAPDPVDRTTLLPVATLIPNSALIAGDSPVYNLGVLDASGVGPLLFSSRDVFPSLVEDIMRDPRGLVFEFANYDLTDEFDRNFAYASQMARDRTVGLSVDFGDGNPERFLVASAPVKFDNATCDTVAYPGCDIVGSFAGFSDATCNTALDPGCDPVGGPYGGTGPVAGLPLEYVLEEVLRLERHDVAGVCTNPAVPSTCNIPPVWELTEADLPLEEFDGDGNIVPPNAILAGLDGVSNSVVQGDDVQFIPFGIDGLPEDAVVIEAGENGVLDSPIHPTDVGGITTGYATTMTCGPATPSSIRAGANGRVDTLRDPFSDDIQVILPGLMAGTTVDVITAGPNGFIDTAPAVDDVFVGPGVACDDDSDCPGAGLCDGQERLFRFKRRANGQFRRTWAILVEQDNLLGLDFRKIVLRPGEVVQLGFIQDLDRDGLISDVEFMFGSSDTKQDTDGDALDDFSEVRVGWEVGVVGQDLRRVFSDPRLPDTDRDGLTDREEQDFRRVQCACDLGAGDIGAACTRDGEVGDNSIESCGGDPCVNIADPDAFGGFAPCSSAVSVNRLDPRRRDTDDDRVTDDEEVLGWLTQAGIIDPFQVIVAGPDRVAATVACPEDICLGGRDHGEPCRFPRDCQPLKVCLGGSNAGERCTNDIDCQGPSPATSGLCEEATLATVLNPNVPNNPPLQCNGGTRDGKACDLDGSTTLPGCPGGTCDVAAPPQGICTRTDCDDVQVVELGTVGLDENTVVVAPGLSQGLDPSTTIGAGDLAVPVGDLLAETAAEGDDQQIALVDLGDLLQPSVLGRTIIRPGVDGQIDSLPNNDVQGGPGVADDVLALGQFIQTTDPLSPDTDQDQIRDGFERLLGSDPRNAADGGLLGDTDGDGLNDEQEQVVGWIVRVTNTGGACVPQRPVYSNPNSPDSDLDGLPDFAEHRLRTDPTNPDTDGDGLTDFDELSDEQLIDLEQFNDLFLGYLLDRSTSQKYGTNPLSCDTDEDYLTDAFELLEGITVTAFDAEDGSLELTHVFTDPNNADTDFDGLSDGAELLHQLECGANPANPNAECILANAGTCAGGLCSDLLPPTNPTLFDSDGDNRPDGEECAVFDPATAAPCCQDPTAALAGCSTDPLLFDKRVTVRYVRMTLFAGPEDGPNGRADISWRFRGYRSDDTFPGSWAGTAANAADCLIANGRWDSCFGGECALYVGQSINFGFAPGNAPPSVPCTDDNGCGTSEICADFQQDTCSNDASRSCSDPADIGQITVDCCYTPCTSDGNCSGGAVCCDAPTSNCCTNNGATNPGCDNAACEAVVCAADAFCCGTGWDAICAGAAQNLCDGPGEACYTCSTQPGFCVDGAQSVINSCPGFTPACGPDGLPDTCVGSTQQIEEDFVLTPGQAIVLWGEVVEIDNCGGAFCTNAADRPCSPDTVVADCCIDADDCLGFTPECIGIGEPAGFVNYFNTLSYDDLTPGFSQLVETLNSTTSGTDAVTVQLVVEIIVE
jgi:hypothetical protein